MGTGFQSRSRLLEAGTFAKTCKDIVSALSHWRWRYEILVELDVANEMFTSNPCVCKACSSTWATVPSEVERFVSVWSGAPGNVMRFGGLN